MHVHGCEGMGWHVKVGACVRLCICNFQCSAKNILWMLRHFFLTPLGDGHRIMREDVASAFGEGLVICIPNSLMWSWMHHENLYEFEPSSFVLMPCIFSNGVCDISPQFEFSISSLILHAQAVILGALIHNTTHTQTKIHMQHVNRKHTHIHTQLHTHARAHTHTHTQAHIYTYAHTHVGTRARMLYKDGRKKNVTARRRKRKRPIVARQIISEPNENYKIILDPPTRNPTVIWKKGSIEGKEDKTLPSLLYPYKITLLFRLKPPGHCSFLLSLLLCRCYLPVMMLW